MRNNKEIDRKRIGVDRTMDLGTSKKFNYQINGLRGLMCLLIVLYHFFIRHSNLTLIYLPNANVVLGGIFCTKWILL